MAMSHLGQPWVPTVLGPPSRPRKRLQFHRSQPPRDGEVQFESAACAHCAGPPPAGRESGDSFTDRSPPGMA
eukprot:8087170-Pyramimonas_sp.AAC.1